MRHFVLYRYYGIIILKSQLLRRKGIVTIRSNIKGREPQLPTTLSSPVTKDNFMIIEFSENDKKNFNKASTIQDAYAEWERSLDLSSIPCPSCSTVGCLCRYDHYDRFLICSAEDIDDPARLSILVVKCASCAHHHAVLIKAGKANSGKQMYRCKHCNKRFVVDHDQLTYYSHQSEQKWNQLIDDTVAGHSLKTSADHISVCEETAFRMRHKLLYFLEQMSFPLRISETN